VELVEGEKESISPKVAAAEVTGVGQGSQATAAAIQVAREIEGREGRMSGAGLGWLTDCNIPECRAISG
jgi:hypothetical protein